MRRRTFLGMSSGLGIVATGMVPDPVRAGGPRPDLIVAADGSGDHGTVQAAVDAAPAARTEPFVIGVRPGTHLGQVIVPKTKPLLEFRGLGRRPEDVVIADDRANGTLKPDGTPWGTSGSASVTIDGAGFRAVNLTFANLFDEAAHPEITNRQAVAVLTRADRLVFDRVRFLGNQDTLYVNSSAAGVVARVYLRDSYVEGDVDFIFGRATAVFQRCRIHSLDRGSTPNGYVTAPSTDITNPYGLLFDRCRFTADAPAGTVFLGRPWHPSQDPNAIGQTVIRESWIGTHIPDLAWSDFGTWPWEDARFREFHNFGPGALVSENRPQLTAEQAAVATIEAYLTGADGWRPQRC
ncbi:pectinesterase family protein [Actinoplanes derwentensis]|uniref:Pectinesterase n=1 Tax=Actinoplanes derwentensis TaxID=113562 RepID=A0A1H2B425_9ACTN|nr:pectinesterase family protein [Actinoplanes derwentensis]GID87553.1 pectinesterase [Actinoplanes derwentensis]SDT52699.1 pectinesterase [Actinoplanes derwentensis]